MTKAMIFSCYSLLMFALAIPLLVLTAWRPGVAAVLHNLSLGYALATLSLTYFFSITCVSMSGELMRGMSAANALFFGIAAAFSRKSLPLAWATMGDIYAVASILGIVVFFLMR